MSKLTTASNIVPAEILHEVQAKTLEILAESLKNSFGPMGSTTGIKHDTSANNYTKDGHTILKNIKFHGVIEDAIRDDIEDITRHIVATVGDGTTSAVMLSSYFYKSFRNLSEEYGISPADTIRAFQSAVDNICEKIKESAKEPTVDDIYDIAMISTNGDEDIANMLKDVYAEHGMQVFIDVIAGLDENTVIKSYDGMTLNTGFSNAAFVNNTEKNTCEIDNPNIYFFHDPIDTREMAEFLDIILATNIVGPYNAAVQGQSGGQISPTVIVAPKISKDLSSYMNKLTTMMAQMPPADKPPLLFITDYHQEYEVDDIAALCGANVIHKFIDLNTQQQQIELGNAPTRETICSFFGSCERIIASNNSCNFINPDAMYNPDGSYSTSYNNLLSFLKTALENAKNEGADAHFIGTLKRRINSLESNLVEISVGGISSTDRDARRDLVEDAVKNCRSAAKNGVGWGANFSALNTMHKMMAKEKENDDIISSIIRKLYLAYLDLYTDLLNTKFINPAKIIEESFKNECPINLKSNEYDKKVKSSIESDIIILQSVAKIITLIASTNQFLVPSPIHNVYVDPTDD